MSSPSKWTRTRTTLALLAVALLVILIWFAGPLIAIANYVPLASSLVRGVSAALVAVAGLCWIAARCGAIGLLASVGRRFIERPVGAPHPDTETLQFERAARHILAVLKRSRLKSNGTWFGRLRRGFVYDLPWYVLLGAPGSGKSAAIAESALSFSSESLRASGKVIGPPSIEGTDWLIADDAVLIDAPSSMFGHDTSDISGKARWSALIDVLMKHRSRRPLSGVIVVLSAVDFREDFSAILVACAALLRERVQELDRRTGLRTPVYLIVSHCDRITGFGEFFANLTIEERNSVWGVTLPVAKQETASNSLEALKSALSELATRVNERVVARLQLERDVARRCRMYGFPLEWQALHDRLHVFLRGLSAQVPTGDSLWLRGVYFASAGAAPANDRDERSLTSLTTWDGEDAEPARSGSIFVAGVFREVVFREGDLVGTRPQWERRRRRAVVTVAATSCALLILGLTAWSLGYRSSSGYIEAVADAASRMARDLREGPAHDPADLALQVETLNASRLLARPATPTTSTGFGLNQRASLEAAAERAYERFLREMFLSAIVMRVHSLLADGGEGNSELQYEALKAYLMLHDEKRLHRSDLRLFVTTDWQTRPVAALTPDQRRALTVHLDRLLMLDNLAATRPGDERLIAATRESLGRTPIADRVYARLLRQGIGTDFPEFSVTSAAGPAARLVLRRASGSPIDRGVPGFFSYDAYHKGFQVHADRVTRRLVEEEPWVLG